MINNYYNKNINYITNVINIFNLLSFSRTSFATKKGTFATKYFLYGPLQGYHIYLLLRKDKKLN